MRTTSQAFLCALLPACVSGGHHSYSWDGGGGGDAAASCASTQSVTQANLMLTDNEVLDVPDGCWELHGTLTLQGSSVTSLAKLGQLTAVDDLVISGTGLTKFDTPRAIAVRNSLTMEGNTKLADISNVIAGSDSLQALHVHQNDVLADLGPLLTTLHFITGEVMFMNNNSLVKLDLHSIVRFDTSLEIGGNLELASIDLSGLQYTPMLSIHDNPVLTTLDTLGSLQYIGIVKIDNNPMLTSIPFPQMTTIVGPIEISGDTALTDIGQLSHTGRINGSVTITNDPALDYCAAHEVDCCVPTGTFTITGLKQDNNCHSYCFNNTCPY